MSDVNTLTRVDGQDVIEAVENIQTVIQVTGEGVEKIISISLITRDEQSGKKLQEYFMKEGVPLQLSRSESVEWSRLNSVIHLSIGVGTNKVSQ
jgi:hypothetical protein